VNPTVVNGEINFITLTPQKNGSVRCRVIASLGFANSQNGVLTTIGSPNGAICDTTFLISKNSQGTVSHCTIEHHITMIDPNADAAVKNSLYPSHLQRVGRYIKNNPAKLIISGLLGAGLVAATVFAGPLVAAFGIGAFLTTTVFPLLGITLTTIPGIATIVGGALGLGAIFSSLTGLIHANTTKKEVYERIDITLAEEVAKVAAEESAAPSRSEQVAILAPTTMIESDNDYDDVVEDHPVMEIFQKFNEYIDFKTYPALEFKEFPVTDENAEKLLGEHISKIISAIPDVSSVVNIISKVYKELAAEKFASAVFLEKISQQEFAKSEKEAYKGIDIKLNGKEEVANSQLTTTPATGSPLLSSTANIVEALGGPGTLVAGNAREDDERLLDLAVSFSTEGSNPHKELSQYPSTYPEEVTGRIPGNDGIKLSV
jgi:hypothetical protein